MLKTILIASSVLALTAPAGAAMARDYNGGYGYGRHADDHEEHGEIHDQVDDAHAGAHAGGFYSRREHNSYHRALRDLHDEFHDDHPNTRHDGYRLPSRRSGGHYGHQRYGAPYGYGPNAPYHHERRW